MTLRLLALLLTAAPVAAQAVPFPAPIVAYLDEHARPDGGFGWEDQPDSHLTPTWAAVGAYHLLGRKVPRAAQVAAWVRTHHPLTGEGSEVGFSESQRRTFEHQQLEALGWLGAEPGDVRVAVSRWREDFRYPEAYEAGGNPLFEQVARVPLARRLLGLPLDSIAGPMTEYFLARRRPDGSFATVPAAAGGDGNLLETRLGLQALRALEVPDPLRRETAEWVRGAQMEGGGFTWAPGAQIGARDDVAYSHAAVRILRELGAEPRDRVGAVRYLLSLWNADGGFGDRPGLPSRLESTYLALDALAALGALDSLTERRFAAARPVPPPAPLPGDLRIFSMQVQAQGNGSPAEAVSLARDLGIHLWGAKNAEPGWIEAAQRVADREGVPVTFFPSDEQYGLYLSVPGLGAWSHQSDPLAPPNSTLLPVDRGRRREVVPWTLFRDTLLAPLVAAGGVMATQVAASEALLRVLLDDGAMRGAGYGAISTFHHNQNFLFLWPYLHRYRHEIPMVALQDAHGAEAWWWADDLTAYRTLFLAREPSWAGWQEALAHNRVVAVRHDQQLGHRTRILGGAPGVQEMVRARESEWRWWGTDPAETIRPWASLVAVTPADRFEAGRPERGVALRVRTWWRGRRTRDEPVVELVSLSVNGQRVEPRLVEERDGQGRVVDRYHLHLLPDPAPGEHRAEAVVRRVDTGEERRVRRSFRAGE